MKNLETDKKYLSIGAFLLFFAVLLGAFGAHSLKESLSEKLLTTYQTGITYHFYHGLGIMLLGIIKKLYPEKNLSLVFKLLLAGIFLFSFNCYFYAITKIKFFALIVPFGGLSFIAAWALLGKIILRKNQ